MTMIPNPTPIRSTSGAEAPNGRPVLSKVSSVRILALQRSCGEPLSSRTPFDGDAYTTAVLWLHYESSYLPNTVFAYPMTRYAPDKEGFACFCRVLERLPLDVGEKESLVVDNIKSTHQHQTQHIHWWIDDMLRENLTLLRPAPLMEDL